MIIIYVILAIFVVWLIESQIYLSFAQHVYRRSQKTLQTLMAAHAGDSQGFRDGAKEIFGYHKVNNVLANMALKPFLIVDWLKIAGIIICIGVSGCLVVVSSPAYALWAVGAGVIFLFSLVAKWLIILFAYILTGSTPGGPEGMLTAALQFNFEDDGMVTKMHEDNPMLEELQKVLEGK